MNFKLLYHLKPDHVQGAWDEICLFPHINRVIGALDLFRKENVVHQFFPLLIYNSKSSALLLEMFYFQRSAWPASR